MRKLNILGQELLLRISPTFLENASCPMCLKYTYVDKETDFFSRIAALRGTAAHEAIADLTRLCQKEEIQPAELDDSVIKDKVAEKSSHEILSEIGEVFAWVRLWRDRFRISDDMVGFEERMALDENFVTTTWDEGSWRGIVDMIDINNANDHCTITDYKSRAGIFGKGAMHALPQMRFYAWLVSKYYPDVKSFSVKIWYLRYGFAQETRFSLDDMAVFQQTLQLQETKIADISDWEPIPGDHCGVCSHIHRCPIALDTSPIPANIITLEQAERSAGRLRVAESLIKELKTKLKSYVNANDSVRIEGNFVYGFKETTSRVYPAAKVEEILVDNNRQLSEIAKVDARALKKFLRNLRDEDPRLAERIEETVEETHKTTFKGFKATDDDDDGDENGDD